MNAPSLAPPPPPSREVELARIEAELASQEARLADQLNRAAVEAETHASRLTELRQQITQVPPERQGDEHILGAKARLESASVHTGSTEDARERAIVARSEALEARRQAAQEAQRALQALHQLNLRAQQDLAEAETGLKRSAEETARLQREQEEAALRAQREREVAARAQEAAARAQEAAARAQAARAAQPRQTPPAPSAPPEPPARQGARVSAQDNLTIPDPRPLGSRSARVRVQAAIDLRSDSNFFTGFTTDISEGGIFVATVQMVPRGTTVDLDFTLPGGRPMRVSGVVRWTREANDKTPDLMPGLGVQFTNLSPEVAAAISDFMARREPMFFPD